MSTHQGQGSPSAPDTPGERAVIAQHRRRRPARYRALYHREYSILLDALARFVQRIQDEHACIALMAAFGSVARLEPGTRSDTDILVLFDLTDAPNPRALEDRYAATLVRTLNQVVYADGYRWPLWSPTLITGDSRASNFDPDFISNVGRDGVLL